MTLDEFCKANPQLDMQPLKPELTDKVKSMDLSKLNKLIHSSNYLMTRQSLIWVLNNYDNILAGKYRDYPIYESSPYTSVICDLKPIIGKHIRKHRIAAKISIRELSVKTKIPEKIINSIEAGEKAANIVDCLLIATACNISIDKLIGRKYPESDAKT